MRVVRFMLQPCLPPRDNNHLRHFAHPRYLFYRKLGAPLAGNGIPIVHPATSHWRG